MRRGIVSAIAVAVAAAGCSSQEPSTPGATASAPSPAGSAVVRSQKDVTVVGLNLLHGAFCASETDHCRAPDRVALLARLLTEARCPDAVALQEISPWLRTLLAQSLPRLCGGSYEMLAEETTAIDREAVLTTLPVLGQRRVRLAGGIRTAFWVRLRSRIGPLDVVVTHLASSDNPACDPKVCPAPCRPRGDVRTCQATQVAALLEDVRDPRGTGLVVGDLNDRAGSPTYRVFSGRGWVDTHLAAGNAECDAATGRECTSGRKDTALDDLLDPSSRQVERIDYIWLSAPQECTVGLDTGEDADGDGVPTGLFAAEPARDAPGGLAFPSDHTGVALDLACG